MQKEAFKQFLIVKKGLQIITVNGYISTYLRMSKTLGDNPMIEEVDKYICTMYTSNYSYSYKLNTMLGVEKYMEFIGQPIKFGR
jgi:hypothetical protein